MSVINLFRKTNVGKQISGLFDGTGPTEAATFRVADAPFYVYAIQQGRLPTAVSDAVTLPATVTADMYVLDVSGAPANLVAELEFMEALGLAAASDSAENRWHVSPLASVLYGPTGLFRKTDSLRTDAERRSVMEPVIQFFANVVIPGRMWRAYLARRDLADSVSEASGLDRHIVDLSRWAAVLPAIFPRTS